MKTIIDASVAVKWFYAEIDQGRAQKILEQIQERKMHVIVPLLFFYEVSNVFVTKREKSNVIQNVFSLIKKLHFSIYNEDIHQFPKVCGLAARYSISLYDAIYASVMEEEKCPFITADRKLYDKLHASFSLIQLL